MAVIAVTQERRAGETRVAAVPETVKKLIAAGFTVTVETGAGAAASYPDADYAAAGATIAKTLKDALAKADVLFKVRGPEADEIAALLAGTVIAVEPIGSSSVLGLLAKPIVDLAVGLTPDQPLEPVAERLTGAGWVYRGDSGDQGGHVFLLSARPGRRLAHVHVVDHEGEQWRNYVSLRDLLRRSADARTRYEAVKQRLWDELGDDRDAYTEGKTAVIRV
eukprot:gene21527-41607_t